MVGASNQRGLLWFQEDTYTDEDSGTEEISDAEDWCTTNFRPVVYI